MTERVKPTVFIGSSREGVEYANAVFAELELEAEPLVWDLDVFTASKSTFEELDKIVHDYDFAVLLLTPDDKVQSRGRTSRAPRDNVLFELGMFVGALGRERVFFLKPREHDLKVPSDLLGVTALEYGQRQDRNVRASVRSACVRIVSLIGSFEHARANEARTWALEETKRFGKALEVFGLIQGHDSSAEASRRELEDFLYEERLKQMKWVSRAHE